MYNHPTYHPSSDTPVENCPECVKNKDNGNNNNDNQAGQPVKLRYGEGSSNRVI